MINLLDQFVINYNTFNPLIANLLIFIGIVGLGFGLGKSWKIPLSASLLLICALIFGLVVFGALDEYWAGFATILLGLAVFIEYKKQNNPGVEKNENN